MNIESTYTTNNLTLNNETASDFERRVEKYLKMSHRTLAELLAMKDEDAENREDVKYPYAPLQDAPLQQNSPFVPYDKKWCPLSTGGVCSNPCGDCINCPYHGVVVSYHYNPDATNVTCGLKPGCNGKSQKLND